MPGFYHTKKEQTWILPGAKHWLNTLYDPMMERNGQKRFNGLQPQHPRVKRMESCLNPVSVWNGPCHTYDTEFRDSCMRHMDCH